MPEFRVTNLITKSRKNLPPKTTAILSLGTIPGTMKVILRFPGQKQEVAYEDLKITDGKIELPVPLVFLSHAKEDVSFVKDLSERLFQDGILTWFDEKDILPGDYWKNKIDAGLRSSDFVIVFLSSTSISKKGYFQLELNYALEQQKLRPDGVRFIIPIIIDNSQPPESLADIQWLRTDHEVWYEKLRRSLIF
jgi:hypothetical protein